MIKRTAIIVLMTSILTSVKNDGAHGLFSNASLWQKDFKNILDHVYYKKYVSRIPSWNLTAGRNLLLDLLKAWSLQAASKGTRYKAAAEIFFYTARPSNMSLFFYFC